MLKDLINNVMGGAEGLKDKALDTVVPAIIGELEKVLTAIKNDEKVEAEKIINGLMDTIKTAFGK